jgi:hypothetical protein
MLDESRRRAPRTERQAQHGLLRQDARPEQELRVGLEAQARAGGARRGEEEGARPGDVLRHGAELGGEQPGRGGKISEQKYLKD